MRALFRAIGGRLSGGLGSVNARAIAAGLGRDTEQSGHLCSRVLGERASGEQSAQYLEQSAGRLSRGFGSANARAIAAAWATTQNNLGMVLRDLGERASGEQGAQYLEQSVAAYRAALEVRTREQLPQQWAATQNNLGMRARGSWRTGERRTRCAIFRAVAGRLSRGFGSVNARAIAAGLGRDASNLGNLLSVLGRRVERRTRCAISRAVGRRLSRGFGSLHARAIAAGLGRDAR